MRFTTSGHTTPGDGGGAVFVRAFGAVGPGVFHTANGLRWILDHEQIIRPEMFGGTSQIAINAALRFSPRITLTAGRIYEIHGRILSRPGGTINAHGATIIAASNFSDTHMIAAADGMKMFGGVIDGVGLPVPTGPWVGEPIGTILVCDGRLHRCDGGEFTDVVFRNCPSGVVYLRQSGSWRFMHCRAENVQKYTGHVTSAVFEVHGHPSGAGRNSGNDNIFEDCEVDGYNWKGFNMGNTMRARVTRCIARGGAQHFGHAAFYEDGSIDSVWEEIRHEGPGFGFKAHNFRRSTLQSPTFIGSSAAVYGQAGEDIRVIGGVYNCRSNGGVALQFEGIGGKGSCSGVLVDGFVACRDTPGENMYQVGVRLLSKDGQAVKNVSILRSKFDGFYYGHSCDNVPDAVYSDITLRDNEFTNFVAAGGIALLSSGEIEGNCYSTLRSASPSLIVAMSAAQAQGGVVRIRRNRSIGPSMEAHFLIGSGYVEGSNARWEIIELIENTAIGGASLANIVCAHPAFDFVNVLRVLSNIHENAIPAGIGLKIALNLQFLTTTFVQGNLLSTSDGSLNAIQYLNADSVAYGSIDVGNKVRETINRPALAFPFQSAGVPRSPERYQPGDVIVNTRRGAGEPGSWTVNTGRSFTASHIQN